MSIKITVDNNFIDNYYRCENSLKTKIKRAFVTKKLSFYPCVHLFTELYGLCNTKRIALLPEYCNLLLSMINYRIFNAYNRLLFSELGIKHESIFLTSSDVERIVRNLGNISQENIPLSEIRSLISEAAQEKEIWLNFYREYQHQVLGKVKNSQIPRISFKEFYELDFATSTMKDLTKGIFKRAGMAVSEQQINNIIHKIRNEISYPYYRTFFKVFLALIYRQNILGMRVRTGDAFDQFYLIYATNLDYLISNDRPMRELAEIVFSESQKVLNFDEFANLIELLN